MALFLTIKKRPNNIRNDPPQPPNPPLTPPKRGTGGRRAFCCYFDSENETALGGERGMPSQEGKKGGIIARLVHYFFAHPQQADG